MISISASGPPSNPRTRNTAIMKINLIPTAKVKIYALKTFAIPKTLITHNRLFMLFIFIQQRIIERFRQTNSIIYSINPYLVMKSI